MSYDHTNPYLTGSLGLVFLRTALPIIFVMAMNGMVTIMDALFLGLFVGPDALGAVTLMFPAYMLLVALSTLVGSGMASRVARHLGARHHADAQAVFVGAHGLALALSGAIILLFALFGPGSVRWIAGGHDLLASLGYTYISITIWASPLMFVLSLNADAVRSEGHLGLMAGISLLVSIGNIGFNYLLIVALDMGVAGSAYGTILAQLLALGCLILYRLRGQTVLHLSVFLQHSLVQGWLRTFALGVPQSLSFVGVSLVSGAILASLQIEGGSSYPDTVSAYGIVTRIVTFVFLPLLGLSQAMQSIIGNNFGASQWQRSNRGLMLAISMAAAYCMSVEILLIGFAGPVGALFVDDGRVVAEVARIMPVMVSMFFIAGPQMLVAHYFQAIGRASLAALLGLSKPYLFAIPLIFALPQVVGEVGVWLASPVAEVCLLVLTAGALSVTAARHGMRWGLFHKA